MFKRVPGTKDILPDQVFHWQKLEETSRNIFSVYNYKEIRPPLVEDAALFNRSLGEATEIVQKQMFLIHSAPADSASAANDVYALRPEATASIVRAYIENSLDKTARFAKFYYFGPMFRMERPQKGRQRQFHQVGCEVIGSQDVAVDIEVIALADRLLKGLAIKDYTIVINSLGCPEDKKKLAALLRDGLQDKLGKLCVDCNNRFNRNVLRILDCKHQDCQDLVKELGISDKHLCQDCQAHFEKVRTGLDSLKIKYELSHFLVRGLDYYTRTVFEIIHGGLGGQQNALGAGGRYDNLVSDLGGEVTGAIGFAFGIERLLMVAPAQESEPRQKLAYLITLGEQSRAQGLLLLQRLRDAGVPTDTDFENKSLKAAMRKADDLKAKYVLIMGDNELQKNTVMFKDMELGEQKEISLDGIVEALQELI
ncbi:MAG: histidine--tRNA ligase [Candidatus Omnitrophota bacterium]|jgi:histidyl-tRNA synthetase